MQRKGKHAMMICDWCGKEKEVSPSDLHGTVFQACSKECKYKLMKVFMKMKWASLTPEQREEWTRKLISNHPRDGKGFIEYYKKERPERVKKVIKLMSMPVEEHKPYQKFTTRRDRRDRYGVNKKEVLKINPRLDGKEWFPRGTCTLIAAHHELLKHDPERLTTEFMEEMCGVDCKCKVKKGEQEEQT